MKYFNALFICFILTIATNAQTLFESSLNQSSKGSINVNKGKLKASKTKAPTLERLVGTNLESLIARGDIHFLYEAPQANGWSTMFFYKG